MRCSGLALQSLTVSLRGARRSHLRTLRSPLRLLGTPYGCHLLTGCCTLTLLGQASLPLHLCEEPTSTSH
ncbi:hypothetical protein A6048_11260 [Dietzia psychralcaliphila]|uniref:Uncharacterized protein n=1 Tax=Dietzia psychralcaliphila TaxID=139021 RepID=A0AAD0NNM8_9ACTN|nr:hypothetical protein A6048_11260 [Dietzia psychralcaliphila]